MDENANYLDQEKCISNNFRRKRRMKASRKRRETKGIEEHETRFGNIRVSEQVVECIQKK